MSLYFCTYGNETFCKARKRIAIQALQFPFDHILTYRPEDLDEKFIEQHKEFIKSNKRGGGYWIWKPQIIKQTLKMMKDNDILLYADAGCHFNIKGLERFNEYVKMAKAADILSFHLPNPEKTWTKMDTIKTIYEEGKESGQIISGILFICKNEKTEKIIDEWAKYTNNYQLVSDSPSIEKNDPSFVEHRHDQSILSLVLKKHGIKSINDETYPPDQEDKPIQAKRDRS